MMQTIECTPFVSRRAVQGLVAVLATAVVLTIALPAAHAQQSGSEDAPGVLVSKGPIPTRNSEPLIAPFLMPVATDARVLDGHKTRLDFNLDLVNNLLLDSDLNAQSQGKLYNTEFEDQRGYFGYARGLGRGEEVDIRVPIIGRNGGILDRLIDNVHTIVGAKGGGRGGLKPFQMLFQVRNAAGQTIINDSEATTGLGDTVLEYRKRLSAVRDDVADVHRIGASLRAILKLPTGSSSDLLGSGAADYGLGLATTWRPLRRLAAHGDLSIVEFGKPTIPNLTLSSRTSVQSVISLEYLIDGRTSLVGQTDDAPAPFQSGLSYPDRPRRAFTIGFWRQINRENRVYLSMTQNDIGPLAKMAPDVTLSTGIEAHL